MMKLRTGALRGLTTAVFFVALLPWTLAQVSSVSGRVVDVDARFPLPGATVELFSAGVTSQFTSTDAAGQFAFESVSVGRWSLRIGFIGYETFVQDAVEVSSGRPTFLEVPLQESLVALEAAEVRATDEGDGLMNEMATVSARAFTVEETDRYAGSRGDPARMASNFAGVQGADDSRNDIVVRGNSPSGVLWRVEGVDLPNPNHFSIPGTGGGPVAILNNKVLANSDFYTAAFPAEFGNSTAAVFDLRMRNGSADRWVRSAQFGFLGAEAMLEGPINREKRSTFLVNYRYSSAVIFSKLGIDIGTSAVPYYQDGTFRLFFPQRNGGALAFWGIAGVSQVDIMISEQERPERNIYGDNDRDQLFGSGTGIVGATYTLPLNERTYVKATLAASRDRQDSEHNLVYRELLVPDSTYRLDSVVDYMRYHFHNNRLSAALHATTKRDARTTWRYGVNVDYRVGVFEDSIRIEVDSLDALQGWERRWDARQTSVLLQPFFQWKFRPNPSWIFTAGWHAQYQSLSGDFSWFEPRLGVQLQQGANRFTAGLGVHSQVQSTYLYAASNGTLPDGTLNVPNSGMGMTRSGHAVVGWARPLGAVWSMKAEVYRQQLWNIPVEREASAFSLINSGAGFSRLFPDSLTNDGTARNQGVELTVSRSFRDNWFVLLTGSLFDSKFVGSDGVERNTDFNGGYAWNALASKDWRFSPAWSLVTGLKVTRAGGRRYGTPDLAASNAQRELIYLDEGFNEQQFAPYFRMDLKTNLTWNRPESTHQLGIDFVNLTGRENVLKLTYAPDESGNPESSIREEYQLGFLPIFFYRVDF